MLLSATITKRKKLQTEYGFCTCARFGLDEHASFLCSNPRLGSSITQVGGIGCQQHSLFTNFRIAVTSTLRYGGVESLGFGHRTQKPTNVIHQRLITIVLLGPNPGGHKHHSRHSCPDLTFGMTVPMILSLMPVCKHSKVR